MSERSFEQLAQDLARLEAITGRWEPEQRSAVDAMRKTLEAIQAGAFRRLIRSLKDDGAALPALKKSVEDPWVFGVLSYHGLLRKPDERLEDKVEAALEKVRPALMGHSGNVELVQVVSPQEVHIRLVGSCDGCAFSEATVRMGIETAIKEVLPTLETLKVVEARKEYTPTDVAGSPFAARPWVDAGPLELVPDGKVVAVELPGASVLLTRVRGELKAYPNACVHLGMPLDGGAVVNGVLTCPYHAFEYLLETGECLTAPEVQLAPWPVRAQSGRVQVQVPA